MRKPLSAALATLRRLLRERDGSVLMIFGLALFSLILAAGMAIDVGRAYSVKVRLAAALDAAALSVGSESGLTAGQMSTYLQNYFSANYPSTALGNNVAVNPVPANADLSAAVVNYQASADVPTVFMRLIGVNSITVNTTAQTSKTIGLEVVLVLDNTGSMLCGPNDGAPNYSDGQCATSVVPADITCANASNQSRICTLINASKQFVTTLTNSITSSGQLYIGVVPYVTTVNVGNSFCTGPTTCTHITTDVCSADFTDDKGNLIYNQTALGVGTSTATGTVTLGSRTITTIVPNTTNIKVGMMISGTGIPANSYVSSVDSSSQIHFDNSGHTNASSTGSLRTLTFGIGATTTSGSSTVTISSPTAINLTQGEIITGTGIPANTAVSAAASVPAHVPTAVILCKNATQTGTIAPNLYTAITYDTTNTNTTTNWMGCVVEPTSSGENSGVAGVINSATANPDTSEPGGGWPSWYPYYWYSGVGSGNTWPPVGAQTSATETQGAVIANWDQHPGPNQGCPVPILPLTDVTTLAGRTTVLNEIGSMWPRDEGGTFVHIGMIWGWRVLSPNGPFTPSGGHPGAYHTSGWKKVVVLMTDGTEEWPADNLTGLGFIADGKINTTSIASAPTNLDTRLQTVCSNMVSSGDFIIYTIGLGSDGASNTQLQNCPGNSGGRFLSATTANLQTAFQTIAGELLALRLTQ